MDGTVWRPSSTHQRLAKIIIDPNTHPFSLCEGGGEENEREREERKRGKKERGGGVVPLPLFNHSSIHTERSRESQRAFILSREQQQIERERGRRELVTASLADWEAAAAAQLQSPGAKH